MSSSTSPGRVLSSVEGRQTIWSALGERDAPELRVIDYRTLSVLNGGGRGGGGGGLTI